MQSKNQTAQKSVCSSGMESFNSVVILSNINKSPGAVRPTNTDTQTTYCLIN